MDQKEWVHQLQHITELVIHPITVHSNIYEPDYVVVVDDTLLETVPMLQLV